MQEVVGSSPIPPILSPYFIGTYFFSFFNFSNITKITHRSSFFRPEGVSLITKI